jgi:WD40 repeat protein
MSSLEGGEERVLPLFRSSVEIQTRPRQFLPPNLRNAFLKVHHESQKMNKKPRFLTKVLGGAPPPSSATNESFDTSNLQSPQLRPSASQNTNYSAGASISCLDRSSNGQRCVIAGAKVFKILRIDGSTITEDIDLRAAITSYATTHDHSAATADQLNIRAVKWSHSSLESTIVTASGNGRITIYDLNRGGEGFEVARIQDHVRQVHKLAISPHKDSWLLSASQDGTVRFFDIRTLQSDRNGSTFGARRTFKCNADAVRDVKWSPSDGVEFACCTDQGVVQKWDLRKPTAPVLKIQAHTSSCRSISWHPDGDHLVSGGADQMCKVWDMSKKADRNQKALYSFTAPAPISRCTWRPPCWSATAQAKRAAQITVAYDDSNSAKNQTASVHIWDLARSAMPFKEIEQWDSAPTAMLWNTRDLLWSVDKEGNFTQTDAAFVPKLIDRRSLSTLAFSPTGDVLMLLEERQAPRRSRPSITSPEGTPTFARHPSGPLLSVSRSDSEEDVVGSFLGPRQRKNHRRRYSGRSSHTLSTTPPSATGIADNKVMTLDEAVKVTGTYKPQQVMAIGHAPSAASRGTYQYFSSRYLLQMSKHVSPPNEPTSMSVQIASVTESFARISENIGHFRLTQTWRLLGYTMQILLDKRAEYHRNSRLTIHEDPAPPSDHEYEEEKAPQSASQSEVGEGTPRKLHHGEHSRLDSPLHHGAMSLIAEEIESTSNVATPVVRPVRDHVGHGMNEAMHTPMSADEDLTLPEAAHPKTPSPIPVPGAKQSSDQPSSSVEGYDFYGMESFSPAQEYVAPKRKTPLRLDYHEDKSHLPRIQPQRHDSGESFQMFSTSGDSQNKFMSSDGSESHSFGANDSRALRNRVYEWENSNSPERRHRPSIDSDAPTHSDGSIGGHTPDSDEIGRAARNGMPFNPSSPPVFRVQSASAPSVVETRRIRSPPINKTASPKSFEKSAEAPSRDPNIIASDFYPWPNDPPFMISPIDPNTLVQRSIDFEVQTSALHASIMVLLFRFLLTPGAIDDLQAGGILRQYHHRLSTMKLFSEAAMLRNVCVPDYPNVFAIAQEDVKVGFFCTDCNKPIENDPNIPNSMWRCPRCQQDIAPCVICESRHLDSEIEYPYQKEEEVNLNVWFYCPGCGHGGHTSCLSAWQSGPDYSEGDDHSGGCCPLEGCLHPCLPGHWREKRADEKRIEKEREMDALVKEGQRMAIKTGRNVMRDQREAGQSKAVEGVRVALGITGLSSGSTTGGNMERKKSVKLVAPGEEN